MDMLMIFPSLFRTEPDLCHITMIMYTGSGTVKIINIYFGETKLVKWGVLYSEVFDESLRACDSGQCIVWKLCWASSNF